LVGYRTKDASSQLLFGERKFGSWKWQTAVSLAVAVLFISIILYSQGSVHRETSAAFAARFGKVPQLSFNRQRYRGEVRGSFKFSPDKKGRFVFVSHYSSGLDPRGLWLQSDAGYLPLAHKLCWQG